jgi:hypothetical protein
MTDLKAPLGQRGIGYLVLKSGARSQVEWEIDFPPGGTPRKGVVRGDAPHLAQAAQDGCATLEVSLGFSAAIAFNGRASNELSFEILMISDKQPIFCAETITGSHIHEGSFVIEFASMIGDSLLVKVPPIIMRDYLPILQKQLPAPTKASQRTSFCKIVRESKIAIPASYQYVCVAFDDDEPQALTTTDARRLAVDLMEAAEKVDARTAERRVN